jgi:hypothetical protein
MAEITDMTGRLPSDSPNSKLGYTPPDLRWDGEHHEPYLVLRESNGPANAQPENGGPAREVGRYTLTPWRESDSEDMVSPEYL